MLVFCEKLSFKHKSLVFKTNVQFLFFMVFARVGFTVFLLKSTVKKKYPTAYRKALDIAS